MNSLLLCITALCLSVPSQAFMDENDLTNNIVKDWDCYRKNDQNIELINGQEMPIPNTIEGFIALVERIEDRYPSREPKDIIKRFLLSFRYDDAFMNKRYILNSREGTVRNTYQIMNSALDFSKSEGFATLDFSREEKCALYYMLSHTINETARDDEEKFNDATKRLRYPREQGVVTQGAQGRGAFALGKVLLGIYAGMLEKNDIDAMQLYRLIMPQGNAQEGLENVQINPIYAATFADIISVTKKRRGGATGDSEPVFRGNGRWNEAVCPTRYIMLEENVFAPEAYTATYALIRGATDGYVLGTAYKDIKIKYSNLRLSQLLRSYYGGRPLKDFEKFSWCNRHDLYSEGTMQTELKTKAVNYDFLFGAIVSRADPMDDISREVDEILRVINDNKDTVFDKDSRDAECFFIASSANKVCDTPADIVSVLDKNAKDDFNYIQSQIIGNVTTGFKMGRLGSSAALYSNLKPYGGGFYLEAVFNNETNFTSGCAGCAARYYDPIRSSSNSELEVIKGLNRVMGVLEEGTSDLPAMNAKVVLYFNFGSPQADYNLYDALWDFRRNHTMTRLLAIGSKKESLEPFVRNRDRDIETDFNKANFNKYLNDKLCKVPAQFQYKNCYRRTDMDEASAKHEGVITPDTYQYWSMDPKHFIKSYNIELTFKALTGTMRVCFSREYSTIFDTKEPRGEFCRDINQNDEKTFYVENPCKKKNEETCYPFYFYIEGKTSTEICKEKRCKTPDDIQYEFVHKGISCNSATSVTCMTSVLFFAISGALTWFLGSH